MSFPASPINGQTATVNNITYQYNSTSRSWTRAFAASVLVAPVVLNDISAQFDGVKTVFPLMQDQTSINTIVDSKDLEVVLNGMRLAPYVDTLPYPWLTPYDSFKGFRVSSGNLIIYNAPAIGDSISLILRSASISRQKKKYPYSAATIAFGD